MTSKWVRQVQAQRAYTADWRFISLRTINANVDYHNHFPPGYEGGHTAGLQLLRVAARVFDTEPDRYQDRGSRAFLQPILDRVGLPAAVTDALDDTSHDAELRQETDEALRLTGMDVGTPSSSSNGPTVSLSSDRSSAASPTAKPPSSCGTTRSAWPASPASPSSSEACANAPSSAASALTSARVGAHGEWHGGSRRQKK
jgi:hypothetical protein